MLQPDCRQDDCRDSGMGLDGAVQAFLQDEQPDCKCPHLPQASLHIMQSTSPVGDERPDRRCLHMAVPPREQAYEEKIGRGGMVQQLLADSNDAGAHCVPCLLTFLQLHGTPNSSCLVASRRPSVGTKLVRQSPVGERKHQQTSACGPPIPLAWGWWHMVKHAMLLIAGHAVGGHWLPSNTHIWTHIW